MAKRGSKVKNIRRSSAISPQTRIARPRLLRPALLVGTIYDRRSFAPDRSVTPPAGAKRKHAKLITKTKPNTRTKRLRPGLVATINFAEPRNMHLCKRRSRRQQVMFALNLAGRRGVGKGKKRRTNIWSKVGC